MSKADYIWTTRDGKKIKVKDMTTEHIKNTIKCIEDGRIQFTINLGYFEDNDFQVIDEDTTKKYEWLEIFKQELQNRTVEEIYELTGYRTGEDDLYNDNFDDMYRKINELVKAVNSIRKDKNND